MDYVSARGKYRDRSHNKQRRQIIQLNKQNWLGW